MKKLIIFLGLLMVILTLIVPQKGSTAEKAEKVILGNLTADETMFAFYLAVKNGYFEKEGIVIEKRTFVNGPSLMMAMANGELNMGISAGFPPLLQAAAQGVDFKTLLSMTKGSCPVIAAAHIKDFKDLNDKVVGDTGLGTLQNTMLSIAVKKYGIKFKKLIHAKVTDLPVFLEKGEIDGFSSWEWVAADTVYRVKGAHYVLKWPVIDNPECNAMTAYGKFYRENPDVVKRFMRAYLRGVKFYKENRKDLPSLLAEMYSRPKEMIQMALENLSVEDPNINLPSVKLMLEDALEAGRIKKEAVPDIDAFLKSFIDKTFLKEVRQEVGLK